MEKQNNVRFSLIYLNYDPDNIKDWTAQTKAQFLKMSRGYDTEFVEVKDVVGYVHAVNEGMERAKGEFLVILNDDVIVDDPEWLGKLANENAITSWRKNVFHLTGEPLPDGACWSVHRNVYETIGEMDTRFGEGYGCDEIDYYYRAKEVGFKLLDAPIQLTHFQNKTYTSKYFKKKKEAMTAMNENLFVDKWKDKLQLASYA